MDRMLLRERSGLNRRKARIPDTLMTPSRSDETTTRKSSQFHASFRQAPFPMKKPCPMTLRTHSIVKAVVKQGSNESIYQFQAVKLSGSKQSFMPRSRELKTIRIKIRLSKAFHVMIQTIAYLALLLLSRKPRAFLLNLYLLNTQTSCPFRSFIYLPCAQKVTSSRTLIVASSQFSWNFCQKSNRPGSPFFLSLLLKESYERVFIFCFSFTCSFFLISCGFGSTSGNLICRTLLNSFFESLNQVRREKIGLMALYYSLQSFSR